ncbi:PEP-CTERM sorting domain-containing protein [Aquabacterium sp. A3]|uniref:PEP-CTERM sorting domain-containing protein n=1 Tax=Aquabacterium sp. A3 TaxID=3132829 RepID=UPI0031196740
MRTCLPTLGALVLALSSSVASANLLYTFDNDAQGVTSTGAILTEGSGFLTLQDIDGADMAVYLPSADLVNGLQYLGGTLSFDAINLNGASNDWFSFGTVRLSGGGQFVELDIVPGAEPGGAWQTYAVALDEATWGPSLSVVLAQLSGVSITLESHIGYDNSNGGFELNGVDNIRLAAAVPEPGTWALALAGLAMLPWVARRQLAKRH